MTLELTDAGAIPCNPPRTTAYMRVGRSHRSMSLIWTPRRVARPSLRSRGSTPAVKTSTRRSIQVWWRAVLLTLSWIPAVAAPAASQTIRGHLISSDGGHPIDVGLIMLFTEDGDSLGYTITDPKGYFSLTAPDPGSFTLVASALGYEEGEAGVFDVGMGGEIRVQFGLVPRPLPLDEILVQLDRPVFEHMLILNGFLRRYQRNAGGRFLSPADIADSPARATEDLFRGIPGLRVRPVQTDRGGVSAFAGEVVLVESAAGLCQPTLYVDGVRLGSGSASAPMTLSAVVPLTTVQAVEIYRSPSEIPAEYNATSAPFGCGVLVVWTN